MSSPNFFRFPSTAHLEWLGGGAAPRDDKLLSKDERLKLLVGDVVVEEKLDGANLGFSLDHDGSVRAQNRGNFLAKPFSGQFTRLSAWLAEHEDGLQRLLNEDLILFGEWCAARHSLLYRDLPDWFLVFDVYDRRAKLFWSTSRRNMLASQAGLRTVPELFRGQATETALRQLVLETPSLYANGEGLEGIVVRRENPQWCEMRAKLVSPDFNQAIESHWSKRAIEWNRVADQQLQPH
ncbi:RNA ligase family protein (plasmid) [Agrobacterium fabrum]|uniref:RNA ligase family protein n=1 Tax=Agrobacterium fabrum TaxID=1176649 RepID=UPI001FCF2599|nr:RNA ligase family protein [Agrobacterium fabrum]